MGLRIRFNDNFWRDRISVFGAGSDSVIGQIISQIIGTIGSQQSEDRGVQLAVKPVTVCLQSAVVTPQSGNLCLQCGDVFHNGICRPKLSFQRGDLADDGFTVCDGSLCIGCGGFGQNQLVKRLLQVCFRCFKKLVQIGVLGNQDFILMIRSIKVTYQNFV